MLLIPSYFRDQSERAVEFSKSTGDINFCITLESRLLTERWLQITGWYVNCFYPFEASPEVQFDALGIRLPSTLRVTEWRAKEFVTCEHGCESVDEIAQYLRDYAILALELPDEEAAYVAKDEWI
jgi:hypothetical protein